MTYFKYKKKDFAYAEYLENNVTSHMKLHIKKIVHQKRFSYRKPKQEFQGHLCQIMASSLLCIQQMNPEYKLKCTLLKWVHGLPYWLLVVMVLLFLLCSGKSCAPCCSLHGSSFGSSIQLFV